MLSASAHQLDIDHRTWPNRRKPPRVADLYFRRASRLSHVSQTGREVLCSPAQLVLPGAIRGQIWMIDVAFPFGYDRIGAGCCTCPPVGV